ncbi:unnamed protein product [Pleuronectes platessa]|uniref:Uncharacterized protein n=1 Tax=Pleuronectes platessa TaxID=8262 RepID=A0A9N7YS52_PLEPL|nr:unnamed protein product [Pleuronectes platessa]
MWKDGAEGGRGRRYHVGTVGREKGEEVGVRAGGGREGGNNSPLHVVRCSPLEEELLFHSTLLEITASWRYSSSAPWRQREKSRSPEKLLNHKTQKTVRSEKRERVSGAEQIEDKRVEVKLCSLTVNKKHSALRRARTLGVFIVVVSPLQWRRSGPGGEKGEELTVRSLSARK